MPDSCRQEVGAEGRPPHGAVQRKEPRLSWNMYTSPRWKVGDGNVIQGQVNILLPFSPLCHTCISDKPAILLIGSLCITPFSHVSEESVQGCMQGA